MSHRVCHSHLDNVLHITVEGALNSADTASLWEQAHTLSVEHEAKRILIECPGGPERISMAHCFELIEKLPQLSRRLACKIALLKQDAGDETRELLKFVETAAADRGAHLKLFFDPEEAKIWIRQ